MATYTSVHDLDEARIAALYGLERPELRPLDGGAANSSFMVTTSQGSFVLTILDNHDDASARQLAAHTEAMFAFGIPTAEVVRDLRSRPVATIGGRPALLKRWIPGRVVNRLPDDLLPGAGEILAHLHGLPTGDVPDLPVGTRRLSVSHHAAIEKLPDREFTEWLKTGLAKVGDERVSDQVVCHGDVFSDNVIIRPDNTLAVIDWETISLDSALLDLGMTILGLANEGGRLDHGRAALIVTGYTKRRPLRPGQLATLPSEIEHAALIIAFHRYYRHNVRFPDPGKSHIHTEMIGFVESVAGFSATPGIPAGA